MAYAELGSGYPGGYMYGLGKISTNLLVVRRRGLLASACAYMCVSIISYWVIKDDKYS